MMAFLIITGLIILVMEAGPEAAPKEKIDG